MELAEMAQDILTETGVLQRGHFRLTSGRHSDRYMQCARLFEYPDKSEILCGELAGLVADKMIELVVGPALGAIQMAYEVSRRLRCRNLFAERENGVLTFRRGFSIPTGIRTLVVEDTITTGGTVKELIDLVKDRGGVVVAVGAIVDRSGGTVDFGVPLKACWQVNIPSWEASECQLCREGLPITKPGSRA
jgi:orotate phosphoribosyltransferase